MSATKGAATEDSGERRPPTPPRVSSRRTPTLSPVGINAPSSSSHASPFAVAPYYPNGDAQTYRDLLIFEERLKQNAARLVKRKKKYQTFLVLLCGTIGLFSYYVLVCPSRLQPLHYFNVTGLLMTATMLLLFFASGMYAERITAANKFVPQANRSLRSFNLYLNTRTAPRRSLFSAFRSAPPQPTRTLYVRPNAANGAAGSNVAPPAAARRMHIPTIPPSANPRGELIFSGKVTTSFREGYERYRAAFERRRAEKMQERLRSGWRRWWAALVGSSEMTGHLTAAGDANGAAEKGVNTPTMRSSPAPSIRSSVRSSPRTKKRSMHASSGAAGVGRVSGSENSSPASSRGVSPEASPGLVQQGFGSSPAVASSTRRGRRQSEHEGAAAKRGNGEGDATGTTVTTERRGRDRTPSVTAIADGRILRQNSMRRAGDTDDGAGVTATTADNAATPSLSPTPPAIAEESHIITATTTDEDDAAAAAAQLQVAQVLPPPNDTTVSAAALPPEPSRVVAQADNRADGLATLREPES